MEKGGDLTAKGIVSASAGISRGVRGANNMYLERQEKGSRDLSEVWQAQDPYGPGMFSE